MKRERLSDEESEKTRSRAAAATSERCIPEDHHRQYDVEEGEEEKEGSMRWALGLPEEVVVEEVLPKLHIRDLFRLRAVHSSFYHILHRSLSQLKRQRPMDLPWFYCMIATQRRADSGWKLFAHEPVAFDPDTDKWRHLPSPLQPYTSMDGVKNEPICSVGSLVCWEHVAYASKIHHLILSNTFTGEKAVLDASDCTSPLELGLCGHLRLERESRDGPLTLILLRLVDREGCNHLIIQHYRHGPLHQQQEGSGFRINSMKRYFTMEKRVQWNSFNNGRLQPPLTIYYHQGMLAFLHSDYPQYTLPSLFLFDGANWSQRSMPQFNKSSIVMDDAIYKVVQMDEDLLLLVLKHRPACEMGQVFVYKYNLEDQEWLLLSDTLRLFFPSAPTTFHATARGGLLILSIATNVYICHLISSTWRVLPPCYNPVTHEIFPIVKVACPVDPIL